MLAVVALRVERNRDAAKAATALIITVNRHHDAAVEQAAPEVAKPALGSAIVRLGGWIHFVHSSLMTMHVGGQSAPAERHRNAV